MGLRHVSHINTLYPDAKIVLLSSHLQGYEKASVVVNTLTQALEYQPSYALVCNPAPNHCETARILIQKGIHCLVEKPIAESYAKAVELAKEAKNFPHVVVLVGYHLRYKPGLSYLEKLLADRNIGHIYFVQASVGHYLPDWRKRDYAGSVSAQRKLGGGVLLELSHEFDYIKKLFGFPSKIICFKKKLSSLNIDVEDFANTILCYPSGMVATVHQDMISLPPHRYLEIIGEKGKIYWDIRNDTIETYIYEDQTRKKQFESDYKTSEHLYLEEIKHFINCVENRVSPRVTLEDACETLKMIELAAASSDRLMDLE